MADDAQLIARSIDCPEDFSGLFDRHYDRIASYLRRRLDTGVAEDLAAQTFLVAFERRATYDRRRTDAAPWLYGIATNLLRRHHRSEARRWRAYATAGVREAQPDGDPVEASALDARAAAPALGDALGGLRRGDRDALLLFAWGELSYDEVARALDIPIGTVRSRINRARRRCATALDVAGVALGPETHRPSPSTIQESA
jgi:RNA polymerase sigma-70 factor (ECF subfamily)